MRKLFILANLHSGKHKTQAVLSALLERIQKENLDHTVLYTSAEFNRVKENLDSTYTDLIVLGGDGTLNQAVNGLIHNIPLSIIPCGTGNDYAKCFSLGRNLTEQIETALFGQETTVDVGVCNGRKFLNGVGIGFDGQIVADMIHEKTWIKGPAKYYYHVLKILASYKSRIFHYSIDNHEHQKKLILLCIAKGTTFGGSFVLTPKAKLNDGLLHICEIGELSPLRRFLNVARLQKGSHDVLPEVLFSTAKALSIQENPLLFAHIDGEYFENPPFEFSVIKGGLKVRLKEF